MALLDETCTGANWKRAQGSLKLGVHTLLQLVRRPANDAKPLSPNSYSSASSTRKLSRERSVWAISLVLAFVKGVKRREEIQSRFSLSQHTRYI